MLYYTTVDKVRTLLPQLSATNITSSEIVSFAEDAESHIHARLASQYTVPISGGADPLGQIATDMTAYRLLTRRIFTQGQENDSAWPDRFKEAWNLLRDLENGDMLLLDSSGNILSSRTDTHEVWSTTQGYKQTMTEEDPTLQSVDQDKLDDL